MGDRGKIKRILKLIEDTQTHGYGGIGKPEPLVEERFKGFWSKRIDKEHRMIFRIDGGVLQIASCRTHYKK